MISADEVRKHAADLPPEVELRVPTAPAFAAMKLIAWEDRRAPRDLFDLRELARIGAITSGVVEWVRAITGGAPSPATLGETVPRAIERVWADELGHQRGDLPTPAECLAEVRRALASVR